MIARLAVTNTAAAAKAAALVVIERDQRLRRQLREDRHWRF